MLIGSPRISLARPAPAQSLAWPFRVNWKAGATEQIAFKTDVVTSRTGREQRRSVRPLPRYSYEWSTWAKADRFRELAGRAYGKAGRSLVLPHPTDRIRLPAPAAASASTLLIDPLPEWLQPGVYAILEGDTRELIRVQALGTGEITIDGLLLADWPAGTILRRAMYGVLDPAFTMKMRTSDLASFSVRFEADPGDAYQDGPGTAGDVFNGREVFPYRPNWTDGLELGIDSGRETVDYGFGLIAHTLPLRAPLATVKGTYLARSWDEAKAIKQFFIRQQGQRGEFFMPTWTNDIIPRSNVQTNTIITEGLADYYRYKDEMIHRAVVLRETDGTLHYNRIIAVADNGSGHTRFTVESLWPEVFQLKQIKSICFMPLTRFLNDTITIDWQTGEVANFVLTFKQLEYQGAE